MSTTNHEFDSRPHQEGVEHGPYVPLLEGRAEAYRQLGGHQVSVWDAQHNREIHDGNARVLTQEIATAEKALDDDAEAEEHEKWLEQHDKREAREQEAYLSGEDEKPPDPDMWSEAGAGTTDQERFAAAVEHKEAQLPRWDDGDETDEEDDYTRPDHTPAESIDHI